MVSALVRYRPYVVALAAIVAVTVVPGRGGSRPASTSPSTAAPAQVTGSPPPMLAPSAGGAPSAPGQNQNVSSAPGGSPVVTRASSNAPAVKPAGAGSGPATT